MIDAVLELDTTINTFFLQVEAGIDTAIAVALLEIIAGSPPIIRFPLCVYFLPEIPMVGWRLIRIVALLPQMITAWSPYSLIKVGRFWRHWYRNHG